jgi:hypothetical protein
MVNHGLSTGALFLIVGMLYERRHTRMIADYGGLWKVMPILSLFFLLVCFSSMGVPATNGFVGELLIMIGAFKANVIYGAISTIGLILGAIYLMYMYRRVILGEVTHEENRRLSDLNFREYAYIVPILVCIVWIGVYPRPLLDKMEVSVVHLLEQVKAGSSEAISVPDTATIHVSTVIPAKARIQSRPGFQIKDSPRSGLGSGMTKYDREAPSPAFAEVNPAGFHGCPRQMDSRVCGNDNNGHDPNLCEGEKNGSGEGTTHEIQCCLVSHDHMDAVSCEMPGEREGGDVD